MMELVDMNSLGLFDFLILSVQVGFTLNFLICCRLIGKSWIFGIHHWVFESLQHNKAKFKQPAVIYKIKVDIIQ